METANPILGNPLLLAAILLFLAILPRALRQKRKTALDRAVERFEKEELKAAAQKNPDEDNSQKKPIALRDGSLAYLKEDRPAPKKSTEQDGGIPPFPSQEEEAEERVKIVKPGVPISHYETADPPPRKKAKLIKREFSIAPDENRKPSKKTISAQKKEEQSKAPANDTKTTWNEELPAHPINDDQESDNNWIEAEIPGLTVEPSAPEKPEEDVPVFKASPKKEYPSEPEKPQESSEQEKPGMKVKNLAPETEEKEDSKSKKQVAIKSDSPEVEIKTSESKPKSVEKKASVASHKNIDKKAAESQKPVPSSSYAEEADAEITEASPQQSDDGQFSPERVKVKPFLLDVRYLEQEESENDVSGKLSADQVDAAIARLNALQVDLENQLVSIPGELIAKKKPANENMRKDRMQGSLPDLEGTVNESHDLKEVSLEELDSFLFTATQRKNKE